MSTDSTSFGPPSAVPRIRRSFRVDSETAQTIISDGRAHLDIIVDRLRREFGVKARVGQPQVAYRETVTRPAEAEVRYVKQTGGHGQYAHVVMDIEPLERGAGIVFENAVVGGVIPREYMPAIERGVRESAASGILAGYPVIDFKVRVSFGSYHEVDSSEMAFRIAGSMAIKDLVARGKPVILEPVMALEVTVPAEFLGDVLGNLSSRRARVVRWTSDCLHVVGAEVPLGKCSAMSRFAFPFAGTRNPDYGIPALRTRSGGGSVARNQRGEEHLEWRLRGFASGQACDHKILNQSVGEIISPSADARVAGPIPLPTKISRYTVLLPYTDKKSREQFEIRTHKRLIDILDPTQQTLDALTSWI